MRGSEPSPTLRAARLPEDIELARGLFLEYAHWLKVDLCFQGFERELATLPGAYAPPFGRLLLAGPAGQAFGCIALRPIEAAKACSEPEKACSEPEKACAEGDKEFSKPAKACGETGPERSTPGTVGEVKRLYVQPSHRAGGWGRRLAETLLADARAIGYRELKLDTLDWMGDARRLYARLGFRECDRYYDNPLPGVVYMSLEL